MKIINEYIYNERVAKLQGKNGHHYIENYEKTDLFCPSCGKQEIWEPDGEGDYYQGSTYICTACKTTHQLDFIGKADSQIVEQLKTGVMITPTTPRGN